MTSFVRRLLFAMGLIVVCHSANGEQYAPLPSVDEKETVTTLSARKIFSEYNGVFYHTHYVKNSGACAFKLVSLNKSWDIDQGKIDKIRITQGTFSSSKFSETYIFDSTDPKHVAAPGSHFETSYNFYLSKDICEKHVSPGVCGVVTSTGQFEVDEPGCRGRVKEAPTVTKTIIVP